MADLSLSAATLALWAAAGVTPATQAEVARIAAAAGAPLAPNYVTFLKTYGFPAWPEGSDSGFVSDLGPGTILAMLDPASVERSQAFVPADHLPVASDYSGHGFVTLRLREPDSGSVWYVGDEGDPGWIAPDFASFLTGLTPDAESLPAERDRGTPVEDTQTGFTLARETRDAWAAYGTGATPEPPDELAAIEDALGRPLPEALRTFLTTFGYVTFFGDAFATFDLPPGAGQPYDFVSVIYSTAVLMRSLPDAKGAPLPFASTALPEGSLLIGMTEEDEGRIYWRGTDTGAPVPVSPDLRTFLANLFTLRNDDG
ncbi:SMI1/KNR4 family protein [Jannaschia sp. LMIT008]|uniref:SMI1/KNR4 family protein n=1 Tax=Jannaschia maritima TaxID=3032585 RepID=UPI002811ADB7|nr:SMI1/KNR4 family protein [Jannaschia sp. LMIT008]